MYDHLIPPPVPSDGQIDAAARDLAMMGMVEALTKGTAIFRRDDAACVDWNNPDFDCDHSASLGEFGVPVPWLSVDTVMPDIDRRHNLERCRLAVRQGIERADLDLDIMRRSIEECEARRAAQKGKR